VYPELVAIRDAMWEASEMVLPHGALAFSERWAEVWEQAKDMLSRQSTRALHALCETWATPPKVKFWGGVRNEVAGILHNV